MNSPSINRRVLPILAGIIWSIVGLALCAVAVHWLVAEQDNRLLSLLIGIVAGILVYRFGFIRLVRKNKERLREQAGDNDKVCIFAFQSWRSYIIIVIMMALGYFLRHLPISRIYLVPVYLTIGIGLFLASLHYYTGNK